MTFSPDGKQAGSGGDDRVVRTWDVGSGVEFGMGSRHADAITSVAWSHDGRYILSGSRARHRSSDAERDENQCPVQGTYDVHGLLLPPPLCNACAHVVS